jgi:hypothetical protein
MHENEIANLKQWLEELELEHRDLDEVILRLGMDPSTDQIMLRRLKKRKLSLKDQIAKLESKLIPDLDA